MCGFDGVGLMGRGNYFRTESTRKTEIEVRVENLKDGKQVRMGSQER